MAQITGVEAADWHELLENWWQLVKLSLKKFRFLLMIH
jgi:hypothetical protein